MLPPDYHVTTDRAEIDLDQAHALLTETYWNRGIPRDAVARAFDHSLVFAVIHRTAGTVAVARVVTDHVSFAWLCDVVVHPDHRGGGVGKAVVEAALGFPGAESLRRFLLATRDAHTLYARHGFTPHPFPERWMERLRPNPWPTPDDPPR